jgi:type II secretory pathway predicted ATPase ExeA
MPNMNMTTPSEAPSLDIALKTLWGASRWPGLADTTVVVAYPGWNDCMRRLDQLVSVRSSGILHGPHGTGKSYLLHRWAERLSPKQYRVMKATHSTLMGADLLRHLLRLAEKEPKFRKSDNVSLLTEVWRDCGQVWPVVIVEEAQNLGVSALEELRLLTCSRSDARPPLSLILCGDEDLLPRLDLGINKALVSRLSVCMELKAWSVETMREYLHQRLGEVGIHNSPFADAAENLLLQSAQGSPRNLNTLIQRSMEQAAFANRRNVTNVDVQAALDTLPWLARLRNQAR